jgi:fluoroquinolone resistance protein
LNPQAEPSWISETTFSKVDFATMPLRKGEYEKCTFQSCRFSGTDLSGYVFSECRFIDCDLSLCALKGTSFRETVFTGCKLMGLQFRNCKPFLLSFGFTDCILDYSGFQGLKLPGICFRKCSLMEADFTGTELRNAVFDTCDLNRAAFSGTILEGADLRSAFNFDIDPMNNRLRKARFAREGAPGLLKHFGIIFE